MSVQVKRTIDEQGRLILPSVLLQEQGWVPGNKVVLSAGGGTITLELWSLLAEVPDVDHLGTVEETPSNNTSIIDNLSRITIPAHIRKAANLGIRDKVMIRTANNTIVLELHEKCAA